ncbi:MAG: DinB family protein [Phycisphaerae bacterium]|nr:DinB family protein [Phycisphaerae bacterium]
MDHLKLYDYLTKARERVLNALRPLTPEHYHHEFNFGLKTIARTLTHVMISEWYYIERFTGRHVPPYVEWPIKDETPPEFGVVEATWREQEQATRAALAAERDWTRTIAWDSFPDDAGRRSHITATVGDLLAQLVLHEVHHRAQVMAMLRGLGDGVAPLQDIDYNDLMYERRLLT